MHHDQATLLLLIRHGETAWNAAQRLQGHTDIPLNERGHAQAAALADALRDAELHAVYSSDLRRARQTAAGLAGVHGLDLDIDADLRERGFGTFEGSSFTRLEPLFPEACERWRRRDPAFAAPAGERLDDFDQRVRGAVLRIAARHVGQTVAVVSHGGALDCLYRFATGQDLRAPRTWELPNAAINRVLVADGRMTLVGWNDCGHLDALRDEICC